MVAGASVVEVVGATVAVGAGVVGGVVDAVALTKTGEVAVGAVVVVVWSRFGVGRDGVGVAADAEHEDCCHDQQGNDTERSERATAPGVVRLPSPVGRDRIHQLLILAENERGVQLVVQLLSRFGHRPGCRCPDSSHRR